MVSYMIYLVRIVVRTYSEFSETQRGWTNYSDLETPNSLEGDNQKKIAHVCCPIHE